MGLSLLSGGGWIPSTQPIRTGNPNPRDYVIVRHREITSLVNRTRTNLVVEIHYPDCNNYEGRKILVYRDKTLNKLLKQKYIDPHFRDNHRYTSPVARFVPTSVGWNLALRCAYSL